MGHERGERHRRKDHLEKTILKQDHACSTPAALINGGSVARDDDPSPLHRSGKEAVNLFHHDAEGGQSASPPVRKRKDKRKITHCFSIGWRCWGLLLFSCGDEKEI